MSDNGMPRDDGGMPRKTQAAPETRATSAADALARTWGEVAASHPAARELLGNLGVAEPAAEMALRDWVGSLDETYLEERALDRTGVAAALERLLSTGAGLGRTPAKSVETLTIRGGRGKDGTPEQLELTIRAGEVVCVVGPTGSGKSRLLCDIECLAQGDTVSGRTVLVDGRAPTYAERFSAADKLVAQLSQSMSYVVDLSVGEFLEMHAASRRTPEPETVVARVVEEANDLSGEPFGRDTRVCMLSGGQSRALMIADVALLSRSPIVLVDELENAGVDRRRALGLLVSSGKIALVATHDPLLMLLGRRRAVMANGTVAAVMGRSAEEELVLERLERYDSMIDSLRTDLRAGGRATLPAIAHETTLGAAPETTFGRERVDSLEG